MNLSTFTSLVAFACAALFLAVVPTAGAALFHETPEYSPQTFSDPGPVLVESGGIAKYVWYADDYGSGSGSEIFGYLPDHGAGGALQTTISRAYFDTEGEIGEVSGMAFDQVHNMLYVADTEKNRILWYPRVNAVLPAAQVNYAGVGQQPGPVQDSAMPAGSAVGSFDGLAGITSYVDGFNNVKVYAADTNNQRIEVFDAGAGGLSNPQSYPMPTGADPQDVAVDPDTGDIYVALGSGLDAVQVLSSAGADLGRFGDSSDAGPYDQLDFDPDKHVLYASKEARVDVINPESRHILGNYMFTSFAEPSPINPDTGNRMVKFLSVLGPSGQIFVNRFNPNAGTETEDPTPAQSYLTPNGPTCTISTSFSVSAGGGTENFVPDCTDEDNDAIQDFSVVDPPGRGSLAPAADSHSLNYTPPASGGASMTSFTYRVTTKVGLSITYKQPVPIYAPHTVAQELFPGRDTSMVQYPELAYAEGVGGDAKYTWVADSDGNQTILRGYNQVVNDQDGDDSAPIAAVNCLASSTAGELGGHVTGLAYLSNLNFLLAADADNGRLVIYPRQDNDADPVDCDNAISIYAVGGHTLSGARGLAATSSGDVYMSIDDADSDGGIIHFSLDYNGAPTMIGYDDHTDFRPDQLALGNGRVFSVLEGTGLVDVSNADFTSAPIGPLSSGTGGDFLSLSVQPNTNRLFAMKADELDVFSTTTGRLLGKTSGLFWGGSNIAVTMIENYQQFAVLGGTDVELRDMWLSPNPICTPTAPLNVNTGSSITFVPSCTDDDHSAVREFSVTNSQSRGSAAATAARDAITYVAGGFTGQDDIAYSVQTQDGQSVVTHQLVNVAAPAPPADNKPVVRETTNLQLDSGDVFIKLPGSDQFVKLTKDMLIPIGTVIDAREGKAHLTLANADGTTYDGIFWEGVFQVIQGSGNNPITTMKLRDDLVAKASGFATASSTAELQRSFFAYTAKKRGKKKNGLWGDAHGKFKSSGKGGSAAVRGTRWYVANYTYGTLFKVARGVVVIDPIRGKNFNLKAGKQFFIFYKRGK